eukprot:15485852-Alexandrium_andersonii.AAC.1
MAAAPDLNPARRWRAPCAALPGPPPSKQTQTLNATATAMGYYIAREHLCKSLQMCLGAIAHLSCAQRALGCASVARAPVLPEGARGALA